MPNRKITVFGAANTLPGEPLYEDALALGQLLAKEGFNVITGGYIGTMEAVSRGAAESGAHVIGITCRDIEAWRGVKANQWVIEEQQFDTLNQRLEMLIRSCDAALALPGGIGTLVEISLTWNQMVIHAMDPKPLIIIGPGWKAVFDTFFDQLGQFTPPNYRQWVSFAPDIASAVELLQIKLGN
jgi:uncharacterized protein (TIGR00730 family)